MNHEILIVDDEPGVRDSLRDVLEDEGYTVVEAANGREALEYLQAHARPCLVLLDLMMPVMNGFDFLAAVQADTALASLPFVIISAATADKLDDAKRSAVPIGVLPKPVQLKPLLSLVGAHC